MSAVFDVGPLTWVKSEIDSSLERAREALRAFGADPRDAAQIKSCRAHVHQASGAVQIVGLEGVSRFFNQTEQVLADLESGKLEAAPGILQLIERAVAAIAKYLAELVDGAPDQPLRLFPEYRLLAEARHAAPPAEAELFFPDLSFAPPPRDKPALRVLREQADAFYRTQRTRYQRGFVKWLRNPGDAKAIGDMRAALDAVEEAQTTPVQRSLWWAAGALCEALALGALPAEAGVKQLAGRIEQQLRRMSEGAAPAAEPVLREVLYWVARAGGEGERVRAVKAAFRLEGALPGQAAAEQTSPERAAAALALREAIGAAKDAWTRYASGAEGAIGAFAQHARAIGEEGARLGEAPLAALAAELARIGAQLERGAGKASEAVAMEVATALLVLENAVARYEHPPADLGRQVKVVIERLAATLSGGAPAGPLPTTGLVDEMTRRAQERLAAGGALAEIQANLQRVEQVLDAYFRDPVKPLQIDAVEHAIHQVSGALRILGEEEARATLERCAAKIRGFAVAGSRPAEEDFEEVAQLLSGLGFFVDALRQGRADFAAAMRPVGAAAELPPSEPAAAAPQEALAPPAGGVEPSLDFSSVASLEVAVPPEPQPVDLHPPVAAPRSEEKESIDEELLEIFLEEAHLVLKAIGESLAVCRNEPASLAHLTTIRRSFHTLKGSGRMVGLMRLGQAAWAIEQVMNQWLQEERSVTPELVQLIEQAHAVFGDWVAKLRQAEHEQPDAHALIEAAERLRRGEPLAAPPETAAPLEEEEAEVAGEVQLAASEAPLEPLEVVAAAGEPALMADDALAVVGAADEALLEGVAMGASPSPAEIGHAEGVESVRIGDVDISGSLFAVFLREAGQFLEALERELAGAATHGAVSPELIRVAHTFGGISGTVQIEPMHALGHALESALLRLRNRETPPDGAEIRLLAYCIGALRVMYGDAAAHRSPRARDDLVVALDAFQGRQESLVQLPREAAETGEAAPAEHEPRHEPAADEEVPLPSLDFEAPAEEAAPARPPAAPLDLDALLGDIRLEPEAAAQAAAPQPAGADQAGAELREALGAPGEEIVPLAPDEAALSPAPEMPEGGAPQAEALAEALREAAPPEPAAAPEPEAPFESAVADELLPAQAEEAAAERRRRRIDDDLDPQLLPVFLAEAQDLAPQAGELLRAWRKDPANRDLAGALQRVLHTFKGGARMAGAMSLGELTHSMETRVENAIALESAPAALFDDLDTSYDRMSMLLERLQHPAEARAEEAPEAAGAEPAATPESAAAASLRESLSTRALLRVPAEVLEKLVNRAGEVSIARSRIETEVRALKGALSDLTENVARLRNQLREIEIQAETQLQTRRREVEEKAQAFDPLEFDRFTRFQELTRMMAESVNDVSTVQQNIAGALGDSEAALSAQARLSRELQQDLMRVRMVPVSSAADRLHRLVRQTAKELGKRAHLEVRGAAIELDRSVLERIIGPLEHLLRNAITHGIERAEARAARGKPEFGEVRIDVRQEGNEVVLAVSDDGAGLNLARIRAQAIEKGLLAEGEEMAAERLAELIFISGFSTAEALTEVAGRGVGMDVVREEVRALGGRVQIDNAPGRGVSFTIRLPLTTALTQAVLVKSGLRTCALPAVMVDQVRRLRPNELEALRAAGRLEWAGRSYPFAYLPELLGEAGAPSDQALRRAPVLLVRSGAETVALLVDDLHGNQEIVVKNLGPQLTRVPGLAGMTVLGTGEVVMILNPAPLLARPLPASVAPLAREPAPAAARLTVMVVDDSLTVRKITGRLLAREGYHVLTAKDGIDALEQLEGIVPDAMLVDIEMPRMDGFDLTRNLRADPRLKHLPIVMITSRTAEKHRAFAEEAGVDVFLGKPYREDELLGHLRRLTGGEPPQA